MSVVPTELGGTPGDPGEVPSSPTSPHGRAGRGSPVTGGHRDGGTGGIDRPGAAEGVKEGGCAQPDPQLKVRFL